MTCFPVLLFGITLAASQPSMVGKWHSYANQEQVSALIAHQGWIYAGTKGGIRKINPATLEQDFYDNLTGLLDCWITGFAAMSDGSLWAVSHSGFLYRKRGEKWELFGRSYASLRWTMIERAVIPVGRTLFLGSEKGLSIFDVGLASSQANILRFGDAVDVPVLSMVRKADTVYIGTPTGAYRAGVDTLNPVNPSSTYGSLLDPGQWKKVVFPEDTVSGGGLAVRRFGHLVFVGDSLATFGPGTVLFEPVKIHAEQGEYFQLGSRTIGPPNYYPLDWPGIQTVLWSGSRVFLGGRYGLFYSSNPTEFSPVMEEILPLRVFPRDTIAALAANGGKVWAQAFQGIHHFDAGDGGFHFDTTGVYQSGELITRGLKNLASDGMGGVYVGSWGGGVFRVRDGNSRTWNSATDPCLVPVVENFPVVHAVSQVEGPHFFFSIFKAEKLADHQLVHIDVTNDRLTCIDSNAAGGHPHAVHVFGDSLVGVGSDLGVALFEMKEGAFAPVLTSLGLWKLDGVANETWDLTADRWGRPWAVIGDQLAFADSVGDSAHTNGGKFEIVSGFPGVECRNLEADPRHGLWVGCSNGLFRVEPGLTGLTRIERYGLDEGLLNLTIRDISVDALNGQVWVATDRGVSMFESGAQPPVSGLSSVRVFPNPFQPRHRFALFDQLPINSTLRIHNGAGDVVRIFRPRDLSGNQAQWDGKNQDGRDVSPGVYLYSVVAGTKVKRGKIIVAR